MNVPSTPSTKRPRAPSSPTSSFNVSADPPSKASRLYIPPAPPGSGDGLGGAEGTTTTGTHSNTASTGAKHAGIPIIPLLCSLPPTCHHRPTPIANTAELESHYAKYHAHVCAESGCGCVFPEARLLALHQTECHDPLAMIRKERGEKIFECHIPAPTCGRKFLTPKARRLHLIQAHAYPKAFFFAVTNKGIGGLLRRWGEGASMVRGTWKPREDAEKGAQRHRDKDDDAMDEDHDSDDDDDDDNDSQDGNDDDSAAAAYDDEDLEATPRMLPRTAGIPPVHSPPSSIGSATTARGTHTTHKPPANAHPHPHGKQKQKEKQKHQKEEHAHGGKPALKPASAVTTTADSLADSMSSLSLVPTSIRFGRGGKTGGFAPPPSSAAQSTHSAATGHSAPAARGARGLGPGRGRGRGRGRIDGVGTDGVVVHDDAEPFTGPPQGTYVPRGTRGQVSRARARARGMRGFGRGA